MPSPAEELTHLVRNGGSLDIDARHYTADNLVHIVRNAKVDSVVVLRGLAGRPIDDLVQIARNGVGQVRFVLD